jgi:hypothetical protein
MTLNIYDEWDTRKEGKILVMKTERGKKIFKTKLQMCKER